MRGFVRPTLRTTLAVAAVLALAASAAAASPPTRVRFARGASSATVRGHVTGYEVRDYAVRAEAGQRMSLRLVSKNIYAQFVIWSINGREASDGVERTEWTETLAESGDYVVRVLMVRAGARRKGAAADYALTVSIV
jgi:hypothetical protein